MLLSPFTFIATTADHLAAATLRLIEITWIKTKDINMEHEYIKGKWVALTVEFGDMELTDNTTTNNKQRKAIWKKVKPVAKPK